MKHRAQIKKASTEGGVKIMKLYLINRVPSAFLYHDKKTLVLTSFFNFHNNFSLLDILD